MTENSDPAFHVFLCHNSVDKPAVKQVALKLREMGIRPWLDEWELQPGLPWQKVLETQIKSVQSAAVFVGPSGIGPWQDAELEAFIRQFVKRECPVIPVLLPNSQKTPDLPTFLESMTYIDLERDESPFERLVWGITGKKPNFIPSEEAAAQMPELSLNPQAPPKKDQPAASQWGPSELRDLVIREVKDILCAKDMECVCAQLKKILNVESRGFKKLSEALATGQLEHRIQDLGNAILKAVKEARTRGAVDFPFDQIWENAIEVVGWLVLLNVEEDWVIEHRDLFKDGAPKVLVKLGVKTPFGAGTTLAALSQKNADFSLCPLDDDPLSGSIFKMNHVMESGEFEDPEVVEIKRILWEKYKPFDEKRSSFDDIDDEQLRGRLELLARDKEYAVITVDWEKACNALNWEKAYKTVVDELHYLNILFINCGRPTIVFNEGKLIDAVMYFWEKLRDIKK